MVNIGILGLQGNYALHANMLSKLECNHHIIRKTHELNKIDGLIIPGGESTALLKLMQPEDWFSAIRHFHQQGKMIFGTCAGMILLAKKVQPKQDSLNLIDITVERNAYGRQINSFTAKGTVDDKAIDTKNLTMVFIRAPKIKQTGRKVHVLASHNETPTFVQQDNVMAASFHPELSNSPAVHNYFLQQTKRKSCHE